MRCSNILVLGGAGGMGRHIARTLATFDFVKHITIAGLEETSALKFSQTLNGKGQFLALDVNNDAALNTAISLCDIVVNAVGPFYRYAQQIISASINQKRPYIDICDDIEPTEAILDRNDDAKAAGIPLICGLGASPGLTNILARMACNELDEVFEIDTVWDLSGTATVDDGFVAPVKEGSPSAALVHWMHCCSGVLKVLNNGRWKNCRPVEPTSLSMPDGSTFIGWSVAHPEPLTLPRTYPTLIASNNYMTGAPELFEHLQTVRDRIDSDDFTVESAANYLSDNFGLSAVLAASHEKEAKAKNNTASPSLMAIARGMKNGKQTLVTAKLNTLPLGGMGAATGIPAALGIKLLHDKKISKKGAFAPEAIIDPKAFFELFNPYCDGPQDHSKRQAPNLEIHSTSQSF